MDSKKVYYSDENDDFVKRDCEALKIDENYKFLHTNFFWNLISFISYRIITTPLAFIYMKLKFNIKFVGKENLKKSKNNGYFIYINHTQMVGDALLPTVTSFNKKAYVVVHPYNVSMPFWGNVIKLLGPLPLPNTINAWKNFNDALENIINKKQVVAIYPEAHVWDYYTKIRNYGDGAFKYPIKYNAPSYAVTVTYQKNKNKEKPRIVVYIDGPFCADEFSSQKESQRNLRNKIYNAMCERSNNSNVEYIKYEKVKEEVYD